MSLWVLREGFSSIRFLNRLPSDVTQKKTFPLDGRYQPSWTPSHTVTTVQPGLKLGLVLSPVSTVECLGLLPRTQYPYGGPLNVLQKLSPVHSYLGLLTRKWNTHETLSGNTTNVTNEFSPSCLSCDNPGLPRDHSRHCRFGTD